VRCVIVDDNEAFLGDARALLTREGIQVVGVATTVGGALETIAACRPELALVDIDLGSGSGFDVVRALGDARDGVRAILISSHAELDFAELIEACPAVGFLSKLDLSADAIYELLRR
jgi:two-component system, NarL family, nitrate/nitrite response regulator NarL